MIQTGLRQASEAFICVCGRSLRQWNHQSTMLSTREMQASAAGLAIDVVVPSMGDSITEGSISAVMKVANDAVDEDEAIVQIETDKARPCYSHLLPRAHYQQGTSWNLFATCCLEGTFSGATFPTFATKNLYVLPWAKNGKH
jgi:hypothetical protein